MSRHIVQLTGQARAPLTGYALQQGTTSGLHGDGWVASRVRLRIQPLMPVSEIVVRGYRPDSAPAGRVQVSVDGEAIGRPASVKGQFQIVAPLRQKAEAPIEIEIVCESEAWQKPSDDNRDLAFILTELRARHPSVKDR